MILKTESINTIVEVFKISTMENLPVIFPTDTIYGIGAPLSAIYANEKIFEIKKRPNNKPFPILAGSIEQVKMIAHIESLSEENYKFWLKNISDFSTFIFKSKIDNPLYTVDNKIAVRIPNKQILSEAIIKLGEPVTATSVNESGKEFLNNIDDIIKAFPEVSLFIKGQTLKNINSNIYDISGENIIKIR